MDDSISRQAAIDAIDRMDIPEDMCVFEILSHIELEIGTLPSAQPKRGRWEEKEVSESKAVVEWQSARCSVCGKYHTTPYMYYFSEYNFCPSCGAQMVKGEEQT